MKIINEPRNIWQCCAIIMWYVGCLLWNFVCVLKEVESKSHASNACSLPLSHILVFGLVPLYGVHSSSLSQFPSVPLSQWILTSFPISTANIHLEFESVTYMTSVSTLNLENSLKTSQTWNLELLGNAESQAYHSRPLDSVCILHCRDGEVVVCIQ